MARTRRAEPAIYTIPSGVSFVDALTEGLVARFGATPEALANVTVLLPTRRAAKAVSEAFLRRSKGQATLLPMFKPIGDVDEDELLLLSGAAGEDLDLPPPAPPLWRQVMLTELISAWERGERGNPPPPAQAAALAAELGRFLDQVETEGLQLKDLRDLAPAEYAEHWQRTLKFLTIISTHWPKILKEAGFMAAAARRDKLVRHLAALWRKDPPQNPVIAAGTTGSIPATAALLKVVARLPQGAVVLPGLDVELDDDSWDAIGPSHPQATMKKLLHDLQAVRAETRPWIDVTASAKTAARRRLLNLALRPPLTTPAWRGHDLDVALALDGLHLLEAPSPREEAGAIAVAMREVLEAPERTAALVTPDRGLARRVAAELQRWGIAVDDSAGMPLRQTPPAVFLALIADAALSGFAPAPLLAALKHPLMAAGLDAAECRALARALETAALRGPRPAPGTDGVAAALADLDDDKLRSRLQRWWADVGRRLMPLVETLAREATLTDHLTAHITAAEALAATREEDGAARLWAEDAGEAANQFIADLMDAAGGWRLAGEDYPALLKTLMDGQTVRPRYGLHPRLKIWGPLEARLQQADLLILGGLNEGVWPPDPGIDPWLSRPMREKFGLPPLERRVGLAAHDFVQGASGPDVILTRSTRIDGAPTVPSRWLFRLQAVVGEGSLDSGPWRDWFAALDHPEEAAGPCARPAPRPPLAVRPRQLSVTQIQTWMRDPYAIYARHILKLKPLDPLDADPGAAEKGTLIHKALEDFIRAYPVDLPPDAYDKLVALGQQAFQPFIARPAVRAFWWPRFLHVAEWFVAYERTRRQTHRTVLSEEGGRLMVTAPGLAEPFIVTAKADRIDRMDGGLVVVDYKTGAPPTPRQLMAGYAPQLPVEALMAAAGGFTGVGADRVAGLEFWRLSGGDPAGEVKAVKDVDQAVAVADKGLQDLVTHFAKSDTPYLSQPRPMDMPDGDYDHLARIKEWGSVAALGGDAEEGEA